MAPPFTAIPECRMTEVFTPKLAPSSWKNVLKTCFGLYIEHHVVLRSERSQSGAVKGQKGGSHHHDHLIRWPAWYAVSEQLCFPGWPSGTKKTLHTAHCVSDRTSTALLLFGAAASQPTVTTCGTKRRRRVNKPEVKGRRASKGDDRHLHTLKTNTEMRQAGITCDDWDAFQSTNTQKKEVRSGSVFISTCMHINTCTLDYRQKSKQYEKNKANKRQLINWPLIMSRPTGKTPNSSFSEL